MNPDIVEVVARAIAAVPTWDGDTLAHDLTREELYAAAQAALTAARPAIMEEAAGIAEGYNFGPVRDDRDSARNATAQIIATALRAAGRDGA
jgi:hypothetical protein